MTLPQCAVLTCTNTADPRWLARDVNGRAVMICDGHEPPPKADEVAPCPPDPSARDLAERVVHNGYSATFGEVERVAHALLAEVSCTRAQAAELAELRDLADLVSDADISTLPPELLAVRQHWLAARHAKEVAEAEGPRAEMHHPERDLVFATAVKGQEDSWIVDLLCGHRKAVREKRTTYVCRECPKEPGKDP